MIAGCYARKSNVEAESKDAEEKSVERQVLRAREYAARKGWTFNDAAVFVDDGLSGKLSAEKRPGLKALLAALTPKPSFDVLIVMESSRLSRQDQAFEQLVVIGTIERAGIRIFSYSDDRPVTVATENEELLAFVRSWADTKERRDAGRRSRDAMKLRAQQGKSCGGRRLGYGPDGAVNPAEAETVRRIFRERGEGKGLTSIARGLERDGIPGPRSKGWHQSTISEVLKHEAYRGIRKWADVETTDEKIRIITAASWDAAHVVCARAASECWRGADGRLKSRGRVATKHALVGFLRCGACGSSLHVRYDGGKEFLFCTGRHLYGKTKCPNARRLPMAPVERALFAGFEDALGGAAVMDAMAHLAEVQRQQHIDPFPLEVEAARLRVEVARYVRAIGEGADVAEVRVALATAKARIEHLQGTIAGAGAVQALDLDAVCKTIEPVLADWRAHLKPTTARQVLAKLLPERLSATVTPDGTWTISGEVDYSAVLADSGLGAIKTALATIAKEPRTRCP